MKNKKEHIHWILILALMLLSVLTVQYSNFNFKASIISTPEHEPFDGTTSPVKEVPDWTALSSQDISYSECTNLISIPEYDTSVLLESLDGLTWGTAEYEEIANAQITYPVVYAGNYEMNFVEYGGSHPAVDIKALEGTPVYSIANGIVEKVSYGDSGFGNSIVVAHYNVPSLNNENYTTTLYSSYSHLSEILVSEGESVEKAQMIGKVGDSGTATTNHLHFQIDNADAPWHPYWPFTYSDYSSAGYSFWDAVNYGLGAENVTLYTINPMKYVQKYDDYYSEETDEEVMEEENVIYTYTSSVSSSEVEDGEEEEEVVKVVVETPAEPTRNFVDIYIDNDPYVLINSTLNFYIYLKDENGENVTDSEFDGDIMLSLNDSSIGSLSVTDIEDEDFRNGHYSLSFYPEKIGTVTVTATWEDYSVTSEINIIEQVNYVNGFEIKSDGEFVMGVPETITIKAIDENGEFTPSYNVSGTVSLTTVSGEGEFEPEDLSKSDFDFGKAVITFIPSSSDDLIIKAKNGAILGTSSVMECVLFEDVSENYKYYKAIEYLREEGVVGGYSDGTFRPDQSVSRVEALKMIFEAIDAELSDGSALTFPDVDNEEWYVDYVATAKVLGIVDGYPDGTFRPTDPVNKVELLKMLFNAAD
ncbi:MAG: S-layer protein sap precursor, partial [uncultured bacterium]